MTSTTSFALEVGVRPACEALGIARASYYRWSIALRSESHRAGPYVPSWSLSSEQRQPVTKATLPSMLLAISEPPLYPLAFVHNEAVNLSGEHTSTPSHFTRLC